MTVPYIFSTTQAGNVPASRLDENFAYLLDPGNTGFTQSVATLAALKALTTRPEAVIVEAGQAKGVWQWELASTTTADDALVVTPTSGTAGRYKRIFDGPVLPQWFGALGDGTDQATALQAWLNKLRDGYSLYAPPGDYQTSVSLLLMPYTVAAAPGALTQTPRPTVVFDRKAVFKATASMTTLLVLGSTAADRSGCWFDGLITGGTFDGNFLATNCIHAFFFVALRLDAVDCRNALGKYIKMGDDTTPSASAEGFVTNSRTARDIIPITITGISKAATAVVTAVNSLVNGEIVCIRSVGGMVEVNDLYFTVAGATGTSFQLSGINSTGYTTYTSGGSAYLTVGGKSITGVYYENATDNHLINNILTGTEIGVQGLVSALGVFDNKYTNVHVWNYLENGRLLYGFDVGGDNSLVGCQVDGPFQFGYRFTNVRNALVASNVNYTALTYGGRDSTDYALKIETGGGVACFGCVFKAQSASARLADIVFGDLTNFISNNQSTVNVVATTLSSQMRRDANAALVERLANSHAGATASIQHNLVTNAGTYFRYATSTAGLAEAHDDWTGSGDKYYQAGSGGARHRFQFNYLDKLIVDTSGVSVTGAMAATGAVSGTSGTFTSAGNFGTLGSSNILTAKGTDGADTFRATSTSGTKYFAIRPEASTDTVNLLYWQGASLGTINSLSALTGTSATFSGAINTTAGTVQYMGAAGGTADALTATPSPAITAYTTGAFYLVKAASNNATTTPTIAISGLAAKTIVKRAATALAAADILANMMCLLVYDGTNMELLNPVVN